VPKQLYMTDHRTPADLFDLLNREFQFKLDACATKRTALCERYFSRRQDGLTQPWAHEKVFMNPPYDQTLGQWVKKAYDECLFHHATVVCLLPASTDATWFHNYCVSGEVRFMVDRLRFRGKQWVKVACMLVIFRPETIKEKETAHVVGYYCYHCPLVTAANKSCEALGQAEKLYKEGAQILGAVIKCGDDE